MATKTIQFTLDVSSIAQAIQEVEKYKEDLVKAVDDLVRQLTEDGVRVASVNVQRLGALDTGELSDSFWGSFDETSHTGILRTDCWYAVFVEYGTGIVGAGSPYTGSFMPGSVSVTNPYTGKSYTYGAYDQNGHGDQGWWYISERDGKMHWTKGQPSRPFFYQTYMELMRMAQQAFNNLTL